MVRAATWRGGRGRTTPRRRDPDWRTTALGAFVLGLGLALATGCGGGSSGPAAIGGASGGSSSGVGSGGGSTSSGGMQTVHPVPFRVLASGAHTSHPLGTAGGELVIRSALAWLQFWNQHRPGSAPPQIDFAREQVICLFAGQKPTSGYAIEVEQVIARGHDRTVRAIERSPAPGAVVLQVLTQPYTFVACAADTGAVSVLRFEQLHPSSLERGDISYHRYNDPNYGGELLVFTDENPFLQFWADHKSGQQPPPSPPRVQFGSSMVLVALQGYRSSGGYGIRVKDVYVERGGSELVVVLERDEVPGATSVITNPFEIVKLPRRPFQKVTVRHDREVPLRRLAQGAISGYRYGDPQFAGEVQLARDDATWRALWSRHVANQQPAPAPPAVDFATETAIAAWLGYRSTGGYGITIERVVLTWRGDAELELRTSAPAPGSITTQVITNPFDMVAVERFEGTVRVR